MPEWDRLRTEAGRAVLRSTTPWFTVPGWITWMTGVPAERHGRIYWTPTSAGDYWDRGGAGSRFVTSSDVGYPTIFRLLSDAGVSVASVNMPVTFPPAAVKGVMISGFGSPPDTERAAHPKGYLRRYPGYRIDAEDSVPAVLGDGDHRDVDAPGEVTRYTEALASMAEARHRIAIDLIREGHGLVSVVYVGSDRLSHVAWPQVETVLRGQARSEEERAVEDYYRVLDRLLGETRRAAAGSLFVITSDHGQGPAPKRLVAPNAWLAQQAWLSLRPHGAPPGHAVDRPRTQAAIVERVAADPEHPGRGVAPRGLGCHRRVRHPDVSLPNVRGRRPRGPEAPGGSCCGALRARGPRDEPAAGGADRVLG